MSSRSPLPDEDRNEWRNFIGCVFRQWFGLQAAISHGMGGTPLQTNSKLESMIESAINLCLIKDASAEDLCYSLEDLADEYFDTDFQDDSVVGVSHDIWKRTRDWLAGNKESIRDYINTHSSSNNAVAIERLDSGSEDEDETEMDIDQSNVPNTSSSCSTESMNVTNTVDADGWTIAKHNRRRNR